MENVVCLLLMINFYVSVSERELYQRRPSFYLGRDKILREKQEKTKKQNKLFCFHHHHRPMGPRQHADLQERGKKS